MAARKVSVVAASGLIVAGTLAFAAPASADQVWHQHVGRASADAPCPTNTTAETAAGWSKWGASYAGWMNGGKGGYVCARDITWAKDTSLSSAPILPSGGCQIIQGSQYTNFGNSWV